MILFVVNRPGWAHDHKTDALARELGGAFAVVKRYHSDVTVRDIERADRVVLYFWLQVEQLPQLRAALRAHRDRLLLGISSHYELAGAWREPGLATLDAFASAVFVNNRRLLEEFGPRLETPVYYTPNGVDTEFFRPAPAPPATSRASLRVGWAGSLENHGPGHRGVHEVIAPAVASVAGAELHLAAREHGWRDRDGMLAFYRTLDVYVCASRSEGTPNPCLEAAACGVPVVSAPVGNMPELLRDGENGYLVERDAGAIAARLAQLRDDPATRARMGRAARTTVVEGWDWRLQARRYEAMLRAELDRGGGAVSRGEPRLGPRPGGATSRP